MSPLLKSPKALVGAALVFLIVFGALLAPLIAPFDPLALNLALSVRPPSATNWLGTDFFGRDILSRMIWGARPSLMIGFASVAIGCAIGSAIGLTAGFFRGWVDVVLMRPIDVLLSFPIVVLALALVAALGASLMNLILTISLLFVPRFARVVRAETMALRELDYVDAARASGASAFTIVRAHVLGNVLGPIFVYSTSLISVSMILASGLSFLGLGVKPPEPEWGLMLNTLRTAIYSQPWVAALPGLFIFITSISFNMLSDGLRSAMEVKQ